MSKTISGCNKCQIIDIIYHQVDIKVKTVIKFLTCNRNYLIIWILPILITLTIAQEPLKNIDSSKIIRNVTEIPYDESVWSKGSSPALYGYNRHIETEHVGEQIRYIINGIPQKAYDEVIQGSFGFGSFYHHFVYLARKGKNQFIIFDQREDTAYPAIKTLSFYRQFNDYSEGLAKVNTDNFSGQAEWGERDIRMYQWMFFFSPDGEHGAYVVQDGDGQRVVADGIPGRKYNRIGTLYYSKTDGHLAYTAFSGTEWRVVVDEKEQAAFSTIIDEEMNFSSDGTHIAYPIQDKKQVTLVVDGIPQQKSFQQIKQDSITFTPDGKHIAYVAYLATGKQVVVLDGKPGISYDEIRNNLLFSSDGNHLAYMASIKKDTKKPNSMPDIIEHVHHESIFKGLGLGDLLYSGTRWLCVVDGKAGKLYPYTIMYGAAFSPDGKHFAYSAYKGKKHWVAVIDEKEGKPYDDVADFTFNPQSSRVAYGIRNKKQVAVVVDGKQGPLFDSFSQNSFRFSPDGTQFLYVPIDKKNGHSSWVVLNHKSSALRYSNILCDAEFTPDNRHVVYTARRMIRSVSNDWKVTDYVTIDSNERAYSHIISISDNKTYNTIIFDGANKFHYFIEKEDGKTYAVQEILNQQIDPATQPKADN